MLGVTRYPPRDPSCTLDIFTSEAKVTKKYSEIALISHTTGQGAFSDTDARDITQQLRKEACKVGADGLILRNLQQGSYGNPGKGEGVAIKYQ
jgi:hypothetical protein